MYLLGSKVVPPSLLAAGPVVVNKLDPASSSGNPGVKVTAGFHESYPVGNELSCNGYIKLWPSALHPSLTPVIGLSSHSPVLSRKVKSQEKGADGTLQTQPLGPLLGMSPGCRPVI